ncbi:MAG: hypothetical protein KQI35_02825 [Bacteroidetes bacterium]|nr:hypothetical protein [Bacteroidota bacterium]
MNNSDAKVVAIISYITLIGWIIAIILHNQNRSELGAYHLRQSLGIMLTMIIMAMIPVIGWFLNLIMFVLWIVGLIYAIQGDQKPVPFIGQFYQDIFKGLN